MSIMQLIHDSLFATQEQRQQSLASMMDKMMGAPSEDGYVSASDGARIAYRVYGNRRGRRTPIICCNGIACSTFFWRYIVQDFSPERQVVLWDYRGHGVSEDAIDRSVDFEAHPLNAIRILDHLNIQEAIWIGHSMGGQVVLEAENLATDRVRAIVPVLGAFEYPMRTFYGHDLIDRAFPQFKAVLTGGAPLISAVAKASPTVPNLFGISDVLGLMNASAMEKIDFDAYVRHLGRLDPAWLAIVAEGLRDHSIAHWMDGSEKDVMVVGATHDAFTPAFLSRELAHRMPKAELLMIRGGSHAALVEQPELISLRLHKFIKERKIK